MNQVVFNTTHIKRRENTAMNFKELNKVLKKTATDVLNRCALITEPEGQVKRVYSIHVPSGDMKYPSFWIRDAAMMAESRLIETNELWDWIEFICLYGQNGSDERKLKNGLHIPPWSIPDHINFDGGAVFYPGTYSSDDDQGNGHYGFYPPHGDSYYFISILHHFYMQMEKDVALNMLTQPIDNLSPLDRARKAFNSCNIEANTELCQSEWPHYTVDWGFCDRIVKTGLLLYPSILRFRAARQMFEMTKVCGDTLGAQLFEQITKRLQQSIIETFVLPDGWLLSATGYCRQPDVWGTAFAVWTGALSGEALESALKALVEAYEVGTVSSNGYLRHIPLGYDYSITSAWEHLGGVKTDIDTYQNGGYWATPIGWYAYALSLSDVVLAERMLKELVEHTETYSEKGTPWEWKNAGNTDFSGCFYGTSGALPYAGTARIELELSQNE